MVHDSYSKEVKKGFDSQVAAIYFQLSLVQWKVHNATNVKTVVRFHYEGPGGELVW